MLTEPQILNNESEREDNLKKSFLNSAHNPQTKSCLHSLFFFLSESHFFSS